MTRRLVLLAALVLAACGGKKEPAAQPAALRIASQTIDSDATLWALGPDVQSNVVAVSTLADDARYSPIADVWPASVPRVSGTSEALIALQPTLVFLAEWSDPNARALIENAVDRVIVLSGYGGFEDYRTRTRMIARAVSATADGERLIAAFDQRLAEVRVPSHGTTIVSYGSGNVAGTGTTFSDAAEAAGYVNLPSREGLAGHAAVSLEQLVAWQPDAIVVPCEGPCDETQTAFAAKPGVAATPAARSGRIIAIEGALLFDTGPRMLDVTEALAKRRPQTVEAATP
ncbi:MAG: ABC transporter substrate-binding protein [Myxococcota bacterium]